MLSQCIAALSSDGNLAFSLFAGGAVGGLTHCTGMCSPYLIAQLGEKPAPLSLHQAIGRSLLLPYHLGRATTYILLGVLVSGFVNLAFLFSPGRALFTAMVLVLAALLFLASALPLVGRYLPFMRHVRLPVPYGWVEAAAKPFFSGQSLLHSYVLGLVLGLLPCSLVIAALMAASSAANPLQAGSAMAAFTAGTFIPLFATALGVQAAQRRWPLQLKNFSKAVMVLNGFFLLLLAANLVL